MKSQGRVPRRRAYRQAARAESAAQTGRKIIDSFVELTNERWFDELTLNEVARRAGVSVQSVIRRFGTREGLIGAVIKELRSEISAQRIVAPGDVAGSIARIFEVYEQHAEGVLRNLAQEARYPELRQLTDSGRAEHRRITAETYEPWLRRLSDTSREQAVDALVVTTDIYTWKLLRRDMGRSVSEAKRAMARLVNAILVEYTGKSSRESER